MMQQQEKGLTVSVYRAGNYDCTNRQCYNGPEAELVGLSAVHDRITLMGTRKIAVSGVFQPTKSRPALYLSFSAKHAIFAAFPTAEAAERHTSGRMSGYMFGGNFLYCSDSRFPSASPIKIFDRKE